jgi:hypothetical protein
MDVRPGGLFSRQRLVCVAVWFGLSLACRLLAAGTYVPIYGPPDGHGYGSLVQIPTNVRDWVTETGSAVGMVSGGAVQWDASGSPAIWLVGAGVEAYAINNNRTSVGVVDRGALGTRAARWDASGNLTELDHIGADPIGYTEAQATAINDAGTAVGSGYKLDSADNYLGSFAIRWSALGTAAIELGTLGADSLGRQYAIATDINNAGTIVGRSATFDAAGEYLGERAVRWNRNRTAAIELETLGTDLNGRTGAFASAINRYGTAVGYAGKYKPDGTLLGLRAVRWDTFGNITELDTSSADPTGYAEVQAVDVNDAGTALGYGIQYNSSGLPQGYHVLRWNAGGTAVDDLGGGPRTLPRAINNSGAVVGTIDLRAMLWVPGGTTPIDLNSLIDPDEGWLLREAVSISNTGWITGWGLFDPDGPGSSSVGRPQLFLMRVRSAGVPEPSAFGLAAISTATLASVRKRRGRGVPGIYSAKPIGTNPCQD